MLRHFCLKLVSGNNTATAISMHCIVSSLKPRRTLRRGYINVHILYYLERKESAQKYVRPSEYSLVFQVKVRTQSSSPTDSLEILHNIGLNLI